MFEFPPYSIKCPVSQRTYKNKAVYTDRFYSKLVHYNSLCKAGSSDKVRLIDAKTGCSNGRHGGVSMIEADIPGRGLLRLKTLVLDYNGTIALDGVLLDEVKELIIRLSELLEIFILTSDTYGSVRAQCQALPVRVHVLSSEDHTHEKENFILGLGAKQAAAVGNGANDRLMLKRAALGIAVIGSEGSATEALMSSDAVVKDIREALGLFLNPRRLVATLRQ